MKIPQVASEKPLIVWDKKAKVFVFGLLIVYALLVLNKIHGSSAGMWNQIMPAPGLGKKSGVIIGEPHAIRSDEWLGVIMFILSQSEHNYAPSNENIGFGNSPMMMNIPTKTWLTFLKPSYWGFMLLDVERGLSFYWNYRLILPLISVFLFFMLLTSSQFWLSILGAFWVEFSSSVQWWSMYPAELYLYVTSGLVALAYVLQSQNKIKIILSSFILLCSLYGFLTTFYPAWQVPLVYFALLIILGFGIHNFNIMLFKKLTIWRIMSVFTVFFIFITAVYSLYVFVKPTSEVILNTAYPGKRFITGGGFYIYHFMADIMSLFISDGKLPNVWGNICEISSSVYLFFLPLLMLPFSIYYTKKIKNWYLILLGVLIIFYCIFMFVGFPTWLAQYTYMYFSPQNRLNVMMGLITITFVVIFMSDIEASIVIPKHIRYILWLTIFIFHIAVVSFIQEDTQAFFKSTQIIIALSILGISTLAFVLPDFKYNYVLLGAILIYSAKNLTVNPLNKGLPYFTKHPLTPVIKEIKKQEPSAKWAVFGHFIIPNYFKAQGVDVVNGLTNVPDLEKMSLLDDKKSNQNIYNRYGYLMFNPFVNGTDSVAFILHQPDLFSANLDPCSSRLKKMGVRYIVFAYQPQPIETRCMTLVHASTVLIYRLND